HILYDLSLEVAEGEVVCLLGRNGAGKTTTLKSIIGLVPPRSGKITLGGRSLAGLPPFRIARLGIGYVPGGRGIFGQPTTCEDLAGGLRPRSLMPPLGLGHVPEEHRTSGNLTIRENLEVARRTWGDGAREPWTAD